MKTSLESTAAPTISLTAAADSKIALVGSKFAIRTSALIAYEGEGDFTRIILTGGRNLLVQEATDEIDRRVRTAWGGSNLAPEIVGENGKLARGH
jgi:hypothetical protein